jgi:hypothetical protein
MANTYAFPSGSLMPSDRGMTLRDYFAAQALAGLCAYSPGFADAWGAQKAYEAADGMLKAREAN